MNDKVIKLSDAVAKLLADENKNKSLGEASEELNAYIIEIKELVDSGDITYDELREEITKNLKSGDRAKPGSLAQLLLGCIGEENACPLQHEKAENIPFIYDGVTNRIIPLSKIENPITESTKAVLYYTGDLQDINIDSLRELEDKGFKKLQIEYKEISSASYKTLNIDNLSKYIYSRPEQSNSDYILLFFLIMAVLFAVFFLQK